jgi:hypothetical protein
MLILLDLGSVGVYRHSGSLGVGGECSELAEILGSFIPLLKSFARTSHIQAPGIHQ